MVYKVNVTISPADLIDLYVVNDDFSLKKVKRLSDYEVSGNVLTGSIEASQTTDTIRIISSGYVEQVSTFSDIQINPDIVLVSSNEAENLSNGINTYPLADKTARDIIDSLDDVAFNGVRVDQTYDGNSTSPQSGTAVADAISGKADSATTLAGYGITDGAKTDLSNLTNTGKAKVANLAMPSSKYDSLTLLASGQSYTAPADGYFCLYKASNAANQYVAFRLNSPTSLYSRFYVPVSGSSCECVFPAPKGSSTQIVYTLGGSLTYFRFVYCEGENV